MGYWINELSIKLFVFRNNMKRKWSQFKNRNVDHGGIDLDSEEDWGDAPVDLC